MNIRIDERGASRVAIVENNGEIIIHNENDALDLMATVSYNHQCNKLLLPKAALCEAFFDLRTGIAGAILQKYTNYRMKVAIVGDFSAYQSKALKDFIYESNKIGQTLFAPDEPQALNTLHAD